MAGIPAGIGIQPNAWALIHPVSVQSRMKGGKQSRGEIDYDFVESGCTGITAMRSCPLVVVAPAL